MPFLSFSCLRAFPGTSRSVMSTSGKTRIPCLVLALPGNAFRFSPLSDAPCGFSYLVWSCWGHFRKFTFVYITVWEVGWVHFFACRNQLLNIICCKDYPLSTKLHLRQKSVICVPILPILSCYLFAYVYGNNMLSWLL
jgi:hypothetical protein